MAQDQVRRQTTAGLEGMVHDYSDADLVTRVNKDPQAKKIETVTVDTASDDTDYTVTVNEQDITITSDGSATKTEIRDALIDAINGEPLLSKDVAAEASASDAFTITGRANGVSFEFSESDANLSSTTTQSAATANPIQFGRAVMEDGLTLRQDLNSANAGNYGAGGQAGKALDASALTKQQVQISVPYVASAIYSFSVTVRGETHEVAVAADTDQDTTVGNIVTALNDQLPANTVIASDDGGGSSTYVQLEAELAGLPFEFGYGASDEGSSNPDLTLSSDNRSTLTDVNKALLGFAAYSTDFEYPRDGADGDSQIEPNEPFAVLKEGRMWFEPEDSPSQGDSVFVRLSANGSLDKLGGLRASSDTGCVELEDAEWAGTDGNLAVVEYRP